MTFTERVKQLRDSAIALPDHTHGRRWLRYLVEDACLTFAAEADAALTAKDAELAHAKERLAFTDDRYAQMIEDFTEQLTAKDAEIVELRKDSLAYALAAERAAHDGTMRERDRFHGMYLRVEAERDTLKAENARLKAKLETS